MVCLMKSNPNDKCVLMFSGGRDSTIAAARLSKSFHHLTLITVLFKHLIGIEKVYSRIAQLKKLLPEGSEWLQVVQPELPIRKSLNDATCLPCQQAYVSVGAIIAQRYKISDLAMGYSGYQSSWPEQTPYATKGLKRLLESFGIRLHLPVYDIQTKEDALNELMRLGLTHESLEQKCLKQGSNIKLHGDMLKSETDKWLDGISETIRLKDTFIIKIHYRGIIETITALPSNYGAGDYY